MMSDEENLRAAAREAKATATAAAQANERLNELLAAAALDGWSVRVLAGLIGRSEGPTQRRIERGRRALAQRAVAVMAHTRQRMRGVTAVDEELNRLRERGRA